MTAATDPARPAPARPAPTRPAPTLLLLARRSLDEAADTPAPGQRYALAHLAALRTAAAVLARRARPAPAGPSSGAPRRARPTSAWVLLADIAPELAEWAGFFAAGARKRAAAEAGLAGVVSPREADDLLRDTHRFLAVVETTLGLESGWPSSSGWADPTSWADTTGWADTAAGAGTAGVTASG